MKALAVGIFSVMLLHETAFSILAPALALPAISVIGGTRNTISWPSNFPRRVVPAPLQKKPSSIIKVQSQQKDYYHHTLHEKTLGAFPKQSAMFLFDGIYDSGDTHFGGSEGGNTIPSEFSYDTSATFLLPAVGSCFGGLANEGRTESCKIPELIKCCYGVLEIMKMLGIHTLVFSQLEAFLSIHHLNADRFCI